MPFDCSSSCSLLFYYFYFRIIHEFLSGYLITNKANLKISVFNIGDDFEFARQRIRENKVLANISGSTVHIKRATGGVLVSLPEWIIHS